MKKKLLISALATAFFAPFALADEPTENEIRVVYPAQINVESEIDANAEAVEMKVDAREPVDEDDDLYDVETPLGQVREVIRSLRIQQEILERLERYHLEGANEENAKAIIEAIDALGDSVATSVDVKTAAEEAINAALQSALEQLSSERQLHEDAVLQMTLDMENAIAEEREAFETSLLQATGDFKAASETVDFEGLRRLSQTLETIKVVSSASLIFFFFVAIRYAFALFKSLVEKQALERAKEWNRNSNENDLL